MNLKEAFRYQNFLESLFQSAVLRLNVKDCSLQVTKKHLVSAVLSEKEDFEEVVESKYEYSVDNLVLFIEWVIAEKEALTKAIWDAKSALDLNMDAAVEANKLRQMAYRELKSVLSSSVASVSKERGTGFKFNAEGNQIPYVYDVEVTSSTKYNVEEVSKFATRVISIADEVSARIDEALVTTKVAYKPTFNVNLSFEEIMKSDLWKCEKTNVSEK